MGGSKTVDDELGWIDRAMPWMFAGIWALIFLTVPPELKLTRDFGPELEARLQALQPADAIDISGELGPDWPETVHAFMLEGLAQKHVHLVCAGEYGTWIARRMSDYVVPHRSDFYRLENYPEHIQGYAKDACASL